MDKKLPSIYKNTNYDHVNNNKRIFYSALSKENNINTYKEGITKNIDNEYILNTPVIIETYTEKINAKIVGKVGDHILTSNNKVIKLKDIKFIKTLG